jgi:hypothetical protein
MIGLFATTSALLKMVYTSLLASISVAIVFSVVIYGTIRSAEARRSGRDLLATALAGISVCAFIVFAAIIGYGLYLVAHKG